MSINVLYSVLIVDIRITAKLSYIYPILNREPLVELYNNKIISTFLARKTIYLKILLYQLTLIPFPAGSIYLTVAITIERYFTVCHPYFMVSALYSQAAGYLLLMAALTGN